jgi:hypothetical protein
MAALVRIAFAAALVAMPLWAAISTPAHACTCGLGSLGEETQATDFILLGTVREIAAVDPNAVPLGSYVRTEVQWTVDVQEYLKGVGPSTIGARTTTYVGRADNGDVQIHSGLDAMCGYAPDVGILSLFFMSRRDDGLLTTGGCGFNSPFTVDNQDYAASLLTQVRSVLANGSPGLPNNGAGPPSHGAPIVPLAAASALAGVALLANGWLVLRRRRQLDP